MINRAVLIICCEDILRGYDILLRNFGNSESRLKDDTALVYITVKDMNTTPREDLQWRWLLLPARRMRGTQLLICSPVFASLDSQSFDCIAVPAQSFVAHLCLISFTVSKLLAYFLNYVIDFFLSLWPENDLLWSKAFLLAFIHVNRACLEIWTIKSTFLVVLGLLVYMVHMLCEICKQGFWVKGIHAKQITFVIVTVLMHRCQGTC